MARGSTTDVLKTKLRKRKLPVAGTKAELEKRLQDAIDKEHECEPEAKDNDLHDVSFEAGEALPALMPKPRSHHRITPKCLQILGAAPPSDEIARQTNESLDQDLGEVHAVVVSIVKCSKAMNPSPSCSSNLEELATQVSDDVGSRLGGADPLVRAFAEAILETKLSTVPRKDPLAQEITIIESAVRRYLWHWMSTFPDPETPVWSADFKLSEREEIRKYISLYVLNDAYSLRDADVTEDEIEGVVQEIMGDKEGFPVAKGRNEVIIRQVLKLIRGEILYGNARKAARIAAKMTDEAKVEISREDDGEEHGNGQDEDDGPVIVGARKRKRRTNVID